MVKFLPVNLFQNQQVVNSSEEPVAIVAATDAIIVGFSTTNY